MINIIRYKWWFLGCSAAIVLASITLIAVLGLKQGIDFSGGALWKIRLPEGVAIAEVERAFREELGAPDARVSGDPQTRSFIVRLGATAEEDHRRLAEGLTAIWPEAEELSFQSIGPSVGEELRRRSLVAVIMVLVGISLYIAFAFRKVYRPVSSWKYGWITLVTLFHDVAIPAGLIAVLGYYGKAEIDSNFVVALLVVMGFSVHDTIVVFDRIRENLFLDRGQSNFGQVVNSSVNQTLARSINTSLTLILVLVALYVVGPSGLQYFILTLLVGVTAGMYSSIFVASPLLHVWQQFGTRKV
jgi:preprotein translocase subunit SecF